MSVDARKARWELPVEISRKRYLEYVLFHWPNKEKILGALVEALDTLSRNWPAASRTATLSLMANLGMKVAQAEKPEECLEGFIDVLRYFANPEPGWDGVSLRVVD